MNLGRFVAPVGLFMFSQTASSGSIVGSRHDLSATGQPRVCEFCHTPHAANTDLAATPLWNRAETTQTFTLYGNLVLGTDLSNDHPISMPYPTAAQDPEFKTPPDASRGWGGASKNDVKLYGGWIQCSSCHNVHNPDTTPFLRKSNAQSGLCPTCHNR